MQRRQNPRNRVTYFPLFNGDIPLSLSFSFLFTNLTSPHIVHLLFETKVSSFSSSPFYSSQALRIFSLRIILQLQTLTGESWFSHFGTHKAREGGGIRNVTVITSARFPSYPSFL